MPDDDSEKRICAFLVRYYKISLPVMMASMVLFGVPWGFLPVLILEVWYCFGLKPLVGDCAYSTEKLTIKEALSKSATNHSRFTLWSIFVVTILFVASCAFMIDNAQSLSKIAAGLLGAIFFAACGATFGYMLWLKHRA